MQARHQPTVLYPNRFPGLCVAAVCACVIMVTVAASRIQAQEAEDTDWEDDDWEDDWEEEGPFEPSLAISGVGSVSYQSTFFQYHKVNERLEKEDEHTFDLEHIHLKLTGDVVRNLSFTILPELNMQDGFSVIEANFMYEFADSFQLTAGRFLVPFGFNQRSLIGSFKPASRPLVYPGHDTRPIAFRTYSPTAFLYTSRDDLGIEATGSIWLGKEENMQVWYGAYVANGLRPASVSPARPWRDNNEWKGVGAQAIYSLYFDAWDLSLGGSATWSRYEQKLDYLAYSMEGRISVRLFGNYLTTLRTEVVFNPREIVRDAATADGEPIEEEVEETIEGLYVTLETAVASWLTPFAQFDRLANDVACSGAGEGGDRAIKATNRILGGFVVTPDQMLEIKAEYSYRMHEPVSACLLQREDEELELPDAHRVIVQGVLSI